MKDLKLIKASCKLASEMALNGQSGVVGLDDENSQMNLIDFERIKGGKPFDINEDWFKTLLSDIGQQK